MVRRHVCGTTRLPSLQSVVARSLEPTEVGSVAATVRRRTTTVRRRRRDCPSAPCGGALGESERRGSFREVLCLLFAAVTRRGGTPTRTDGGRRVSVGKGWSGPSRGGLGVRGGTLKRNSTHPQKVRRPLGPPSHPPPPPPPGVRTVKGDPHVSGPDLRLSTPRRRYLRRRNLLGSTPTAGGQSVSQLTKSFEHDQRHTPSDHPLRPRYRVLSLSSRQDSLVS